MAALLVGGNTGYLALWSPRPCCSRSGAEPRLMKARVFLPAIPKFLQVSGDCRIKVRLGRQIHAPCK